MPNGSAGKSLTTRASKTGAALYRMRHYDHYADIGIMVIVLVIPKDLTGLKIPFQLLVVWIIPGKSW